MSRVIKNKSSVVKPNIYILEKVLLQFKAYCASTDKEIGWLAFVEKKDNDYIIYDTILPKQEITSVTTELTEQGLQDISEEILMTRPDEFNNIRCWCHSHVNMAVFASGTDEETFEQFYSNCDYFIRIICNKKNDIKVDFVDLEQEVRFDNIEWSFYTLPETEAKYLAIDSYEEIVKKSQEEIKKLKDEISKLQNAIYDTIKKEIDLDVKKKLVEEQLSYSCKHSNVKKEDKYYSDWYNTNVNEFDEEFYRGLYESTVDWSKLSQKEKEDFCVLSNITLKDSNAPSNKYDAYIDPDEVLSKKEYVRMLEVSTVAELKSLLKDKKFASKYTDDDWSELYVDIEYYGILAIEEELERSGVYDY